MESHTWTWLELDKTIAGQILIETRVLPDRVVVVTYLVQVEEVIRRNISNKMANFITIDMETKAMSLVEDTLKTTTCKTSSKSTFNRPTVSLVNLNSLINRLPFPELKMGREQTQADAVSNRKVSKCLREAWPISSISISCSCNINSSSNNKLNSRCVMNKSRS